MALKSDAAAEKSKDQLSRDFPGRSIFDFCNNIGAKRTTNGKSTPDRETDDRGHRRCRDKRSIATLVSSSPALFFARLFGPGVESGYRPIRLPELHIVAVDEPPGGFDGGLIIDTIRSNHANGSIV